MSAEARLKAVLVVKPPRCPIEVTRQPMTTLDAYDRGAKDALAAVRAIAGGPGAGSARAMTGGSGSGWVSEARAAHRRSEHEDRWPGDTHYCVECDKAWPCDASRALDVIDQIRAALDAVPDEDPEPVDLSAALIEIHDAIESLDAGGLVGETKT